MHFFNAMKSPRLLTPTPTRASKSFTAPSAQTRGLVTMRILKLLASTPLGYASIKALHAQLRTGAPDSKQLLEDIQRRLAGDGAMTPEQHTMLADALRRQPTWISDAPCVSGDDLAKIVGDHGPVMLTAQARLPGVDEEPTPRRSDVALLMATFKHGGRTLGVVVTPNQVDRNPAMTELKEYMQRHDRDVSQMDQHEIESLCAALVAENPAGPDPTPNGFVLVDLDELTASHETKAAKLGANSSSNIEPLSGEVVDELCGVLDRREGEVENWTSVFSADGVESVQPKKESKNVEIERRYLAHDDSWRASVTSSTEMRQGYLSQKPECTVRVRVAGDKAWLTVKGLTKGATRSEHEYEIPKETARRMLDKLPPNETIHKIRHTFEFEEKTYEVDEFKGLNDKLCVIEIELDNETEEFKKHPSLGKEITEDYKYTNSKLSKRPFTEWAESERD